MQGNFFIMQNIKEFGGFKGQTPRAKALFCQGSERAKETQS
jgi:hypothetical protein